jgi:high-affinity iron transporter
MLANYLIGLREGLEASLVVSILATFLVKAGRRDKLKLVWAGVVAALAVAAVGWGLLQFVTALTAKSFTTQETIGGVMSIVAVGVMAFLAVVREGLETALIFYSAVQGASVNGGPLYALLGGIATAIAIGYLMYATAIRINLSVFFTWTGALLILVAAGIFAYGFHDLQEAGILPGLQTHAFDISQTVPPDSWYGVLLKGIFNFNPAPTLVELGAWLLYLVPVLTVYLRPVRRKTSPPQAVVAEVA